MKAAGNLGIAWSGGLGSTVLLDLVYHAYYAPRSSSVEEGGTQHPRHTSTAPWDKAFVFYVQTASAVPDAKIRTETARSYIEDKYPGAFEFVGVKVEDAFDQAWWQSVSGSTSRDMLVDLGSDSLPISPSASDQDATSTSTQRLTNYLSSLPSPATSIPTALANLVRLILLYTSTSPTHRCSELLLGTSLTTLSVSLISGIAQGGGSAVQDHVSETWAPVPGAGQPGTVLRIERPLRDSGMKECGFWSWWNDLKVFRDRSDSIVPVGKNVMGIGQLTRDFIVGLETDFPSTVSTIARTCGKLAPKESQLLLPIPSDGQDRCVLCERSASYPCIVLRF